MTSENPVKNALFSQPVKKLVSFYFKRKTACSHPVKRITFSQDFHRVIVSKKNCMASVRFLNHLKGT